MSRLLEPAEAAEALGVSETELEERRRRRQSPAWIELSPRTIRYHPEDLEQTG